KKVCGQDHEPFFAPFCYGHKGYLPNHEFRVNFESVSPTFIVALLPLYFILHITSHFPCSHSLYSLLLVEAILSVTTEGSVMSKAKQKAVLLLLITGVLTLLLAMSLPNLRLFPGQPFSLGQTDSVLGIGAISDGEVFLHLFRAFLAVTLLLLPVYILYS